ncbi:FAD-dependent oxidoreductase [Microbacterium lacus]|uniref:NAD(P)/FAD-dependent oxidoreductase n=1 Tax=Microbacterium lacus TaxID=415217 RepID=UPI0038514517
MAIEVLVLGGGYTGVWAARRIARAQRRGVHDDVRVTLVSASDVHGFHGWTAEVITGHVREHRARVALAELLPGVRLVRGVVTHVDLENREVQVVEERGIRVFRYDELVIGVGSRDARERVPGLREHGWSLKDDGGLEALNAHLAEVVSDAASISDSVERARLLTVAVAGGGFAGAEASTAIAQRLRAALDATPALAGERARVVLVHSGSSLLSELRPRFARVADYSARHVVASGVEMRGGVRVVSVTPAGAQLRDGSFIASATVVSAIGQAPVALAGTEGLPRDAAGRAITDRYLRVAPHVWAGGDSAAVPHPSGRGACPTNALWAIFHGKRIGANVLRKLRGRRPAPFRFPGLGQGASFGVGRGAAELYGVQLTGWVAWIARWGFFHWFMPSRRVALATAREWFAGPVIAAVPSGEVARGYSGARQY